MLSPFMSASGFCGDGDGGGSGGGVQLVHIKPLSMLSLLLPLLLLRLPRRLRTCLKRLLACRS
jgi:hypothetical protein